MQVTNFQTTLYHNLQDHDVSTDVKYKYRTPFDNTTLYLCAIK